MHKSLKGTGKNTVFYRQVDNTKKIRSGFLYKSPGKPTIKGESSWKRRFFVLNMSESLPRLRYYESNESERPYGDIDLTLVSVLCVGPENHSKWASIEKMFKCSPSCVLFMQYSNRELFLIGETSDEVDLWFSALYEAMKNRPHRVNSTDTMPNGQNKVEQISKPSVHRKPSLGLVDKITSLRSTPNDKSAARVEPSLGSKPVSDPDSKSKPGAWEKHPPGRGLHKTRSMSDPCALTVLNGAEKCQGDGAKRPTSEPVYDCPKSILQQIKDEEDGSASAYNTEAIYEPMDSYRNGAVSPTESPEEYVMRTGTIVRCVNVTFEKLKKQLSPMSSFSEETAEDGEDYSSSSSDTGPISPMELTDKHFFLEKRASLDSPDHLTKYERNIEVNHADLKKHLTVCDLKGKVSVLEWTGQPETVCLFHRGDQILGLNDLKIDSADEFHAYIRKSLRNEMKITILRRPGNLPLHSPSAVCSDSQDSDTLPYSSV